MSEFLRKLRIYAVLAPGNLNSLAHSIWHLIFFNLHLRNLLLPIQIVSGIIQIQWQNNASANTGDSNVCTINMCLCSLPSQVPLTRILRFNLKLLNLTFLCNCISWKAFNSSERNCDRLLNVYPHDYFI